MKLYPTKLKGTVTPPTSKSILHRELICQALCGKYPYLTDAAEDVRATQKALLALRDGEKRIPCAESGSTLRMLLPVAAALGKTDVVFTGSKHLLQRPVPDGLPIARVSDGWRVDGCLHSGEYNIDGSQTSQVTSGLLLALPLLPGDSVVYVKDPVSTGYVEMTISILQRYGIHIERSSDGYSINGGQKYQLTSLQTEMDWSAAAWYMAANALGCEVDIKKDGRESLQPDSRIAGLCEKLPDCIDISKSPDLFPVLALLGALQNGKTTRFFNGQYLRYKESDRLETVCRILTGFGVKVTATEDAITVCGISKLRGGGTFNPQNDHRMAFLVAFGALFCDRAVELVCPDCVGKSYPRFWEDYIALGGIVEE